ncbi:MAG: glycosyltransferase family 2 protein [Brevefilum sp.]
MTNEFHVSVIIAVYNAERFVTQAVQSALAQPETAEVILIEDGSPDNALEVCQSLAKKHSRVCLLRHPDGENRGAPASFNLGMKKANCEYLAILGADDYYLPGRFSVAKEIFASNPDCDGVYEAIGTIVQNEEAELRWRKSKEMQSNLITMTKFVPPEKLLEKLVLGGAGYFSPNGLVFKRNLVNLTGYMDESLRLHQDNDFMFKLAAVSKLLPGRLGEPVAIRRVHKNNRITAPRSENQRFADRMKMWKVSYRWFLANSNREKRELILQALTNFWMNNYTKTTNHQFYYLRELMKRISLFILPFSLPEVVFEPYFWFRFLPTRLRQKYR